jgi:hypothetical protein
MTSATYSPAAVLLDQSTYGGPAPSSLLASHMIIAACSGWEMIAFNPLTAPGPVTPIINDALFLGNSATVALLHTVTITVKLNRCFFMNNSPGKDLKS